MPVPMPSPVPGDAAAAALVMAACLEQPGAAGLVVRGLRLGAATGVTAWDLDAAVGLALAPAAWRGWHRHPADARFCLMIADGPGDRAPWFFDVPCPGGRPRPSPARVEPIRRPGRPREAAPA